MRVPPTGPILATPQSYVLEPRHKAPPLRLSDGANGVRGCYFTSERITRRSPKYPGSTIHRANDVAMCAQSEPVFIPSNNAVCAKGRSTHGCRSLNQSWLAARRLVRLGTSRTSTKYMTRPPAELRSSIPSMVPIDIETRLPSTIVRAWPTERSQTVEVPAMALPATFPTAPITNANSIEATATSTAESVLAQITRCRLGT